MKLTKEAIIAMVIVVMIVSVAIVAIITLLPSWYETDPNPDPVLVNTGVQRVEANQTVSYDFSTRIGTLEHASLEVRVYNYDNNYSVKNATLVLDGQTHYLEFSPTNMNSGAYGGSVFVTIGHMDSGKHSGNLNIEYERAGSYYVQVVLSDEYE